MENGTPLSMRQSDSGHWEVQDSSENWIKCLTESDAKILSNAPLLRAKLDKTPIPNQAIADELEKTAKIMKRYNMSGDSRYFQAMAERARGRKSC